VLAGVARLLRVVAVRPVLKVAAGATAVGVASIAVAALVRALLPGSSDTEPVPGIWVAVAGPSADTAADMSLSWTIRVFDVVTGREYVVGNSASYAALALSPGGDRLAAIEVDTSEDSPAGNVQIWSATGHAIARVPFRGAAEAPTALAFSPDGTRLAAIGSGGVTMLDSSGRELGRAGLTPLADGVRSVGGRAADYWSPDSRYLAVYANDLLLVVDRGGAGREFDLPPALLDSLARESVGVVPHGWKGPDRVALVATGPAGAEEYVGVVGGPSIQWGDPAPFDFASFSPDQQILDQLNTLVPGTAVARIQPTADRSADVFLLSEKGAPPAATNRTALAIRLKDEKVIVDLSATGPPILQRLPFDVVVVPGWSGSLPPHFDAATPMSAATPRALPSAFETPFGVPASETPLTFASPDLAVTPLPYPSPRGQRVTPQVAGLPSYPGADEIDGFTKQINGAPAAVQMFATVDRDRQVLDFFESELTAAGFRKTSGGLGVAGEQWAYLRGRDRVMVSTEYMARPADERGPGEVPYGFQGKGERFVDRVNGKTWFFLVTIRAP
jgi:hypothetical protein